MIICKRRRDEEPLDDYTVSLATRRLIKSRYFSRHIRERNFCISTVITALTTLHTAGGTYWVENLTSCDATRVEHSRICIEIHSNVGSRADVLNSNRRHGLIDVVDHSYSNLAQYLDSDGLYLEELEEYFDDDNDEDDEYFDDDEPETIPDPNSSGVRTFAEIMRENMYATSSSSNIEFLTTAAYRTYLERTNSILESALEADQRVSERLSNFT